MYRYAANNPVKYTDPDGRDIKTLTLTGAGAKLVIGASVSIGISWDDAAVIAITVTGNAGVGIEAKIDSLISPTISITKGKNIRDNLSLGPFYVDCDFSWKGLGVDVGILFGFSYNMNSNDFDGLNMGIIGGGVNFLTGSLYIDIKQAAGKLYNIFGDSLQSVKDLLVDDNVPLPDDVRKELKAVLFEEIYSGNGGKFSGGGASGDLIE